MNFYDEEKSHPVGFWKKMFGKSKTTHLVEKSRSIGRMSDTLLRYIMSVKRGEKAIVIGDDYVVMSRAMYDEITKKNREEVFRAKTD